MDVAFVFLLECLLVNGKGGIHPFVFRFVFMLKCDIE